MTTIITQSYVPAEAERGKFLVADTTDAQYATYTGDDGKYCVLVSDVANVDFSIPYAVCAEAGKFIPLDDTTFPGYSGDGKYAMLIHDPGVGVDFTLPYVNAEAERGKFVKVDDVAEFGTTYTDLSGEGKYAVLVHEVALGDCDFTIPYNTAEAERGKFVKITGALPGYPIDGDGKYAMLIVRVTGAVVVTDGYVNAEAERGKFVRISDGAIGLPAGSAGRYAVIVYA
jgi:hypothetical protein